MMGKDAYHRRTFAGPIRLGATDTQELRDCIEYSQLLSSDVSIEVSDPFLPDFTACLIRSPRDPCTDLPSSLALSSNAASERSKVQRGACKPLTFIPKDCIRVATSLPILPRPRIPSVFPFSSVPMNCNQTGKRPRRPSQDQEWDLGAEPKWARQGNSSPSSGPICHLSWKPPPGESAWKKTAGSVDHPEYGARTAQHSHHLSVILLGTTLTHQGHGGSGSGSLCVRGAGKERP